MVSMRLMGSESTNDEDGKNVIAYSRRAWFFKDRPAHCEPSDPLDEVSNDTDGASVLDSTMKGP